MKLVCDCGNTLEFDETEPYEDMEGTYCETNGCINIFSSNEEAWFVCKKCEKALCLIT